MPGRPTKEEKDLIAESNREGSDGISDAQLARLNQLRARRGAEPIEEQD